MITDKSSAQAFLKLNSLGLCAEKTLGARVESGRWLGGIIWAVGDGRWNQSESMTVRDEEFFKSIQHSS